MYFYLTDSLTRKFIYELRQFWQHHPKFRGMVDSIQGKYSFKERPQQSIVVKTSGGSHISLSPDHYKGMVMSHVYLAKRVGKPGLSVEWVREDAVAIQNNDGRFPSPPGVYYIDVVDGATNGLTTKMGFFVDPLIDVRSEQVTSIDASTYQLATPPLAGTLRLFEMPAGFLLRETVNYTVTLDEQDKPTGEIKLIEPITSFLSVADLGLSGADAVSAATDLQAAGVVAGMLLEIDVAAESSGAYEVLSVATDTATVEFNFTADEDPVSGEFFSLDDAWEVLDDTVTLSGTLNLEFGPMMATEFPDAVNSSTFLTVSPQTFTGTAGTAFETDFQVGDVVRLEGDSDLDWAIIAEIVSDTEITLDRNYTGTSPGAGRVERGTPGGLVLPGDYFTCDEGVFVVKTVQAATMTLTSDTGVSPLADYTGKVTRKLR